nr:hypothetical protein KitaXyl93_61280 [Kitasatospora sp. Xyl93]
MVGHPVVGEHREPLGGQGPEQRLDGGEPQPFAPSVLLFRIDGRPVTAPAVPVRTVVLALPALTVSVAVMEEIVVKDLVVTALVVTALVVKEFVVCALAEQALTALTIGMQTVGVQAVDGPADGAPARRPPGGRRQRAHAGRRPRAGRGDRCTGLGLRHGSPSFAERRGGTAGGRSPASDSRGGGSAPGYSCSRWGVHTRPSNGSWITQCH